MEYTEFTSSTLGESLGLMPELRHSNFDGGLQSEPHSMRNKHNIFVIAAFQVLSLIIHKLKFCSWNNNYQDMFSKENKPIPVWEGIPAHRNCSACFSYASKSSNIKLMIFFLNLGFIYQIMFVCLFSSFFPLVKGMGWDKQSNGKRYLPNTYIKLHGIYVIL